VTSSIYFRLKNPDGLFWQITRKQKCFAKFYTMSWESENLSDDLKEKIRNFVWSNLSSRRIMAQTADLYISNVFSVIVAILGGKKDDEKQGIIK